MQVIGNQIIRLQDVDSTNNYAANLINTPFAIEGTVILAHNQFGGKGQRGADWNSEAGLNLTFSLLLNPKCAASDQFYLSKMVAVAVAKALAFVSGNPAEIKWPNDVIIGNKKVAGILIENNIAGSLIASTIIGIGINVNQENFINLPQATSLSVILGQKLDIERVLQEVLARLDHSYQLFLSGSIQSISKQYDDLLFRKDMESDFLVNGILQKGTILGVKQNGLIEIEFSSGQSKLFDLKEIQLVY